MSAHFMFGRRVDVVDTQPAEVPEPHAVSRRPFPGARFLRWLRCCWLRFEIHSAERWMQDYGADLLRTGIDDGLALRDCRLHLQDLRVRLAILEGSL